MVVEPWDFYDWFEHGSLQARDFHGLSYLEEIMHSPAFEGLPPSDDSA